MSNTMRAIVLTGHGGMDKLEYHTDWQKPAAGAGEALVRVLACGLNNTDVNTRVGWYSKSVTGATSGDAADAGAADDATWGGAPIALPRIQGADVCGVVEAVGAGVDAGVVGKRVLIDTWLRDWDNPHDLEKTGYFGSECDGGYAEYTKIDARHLHPIDSARCPRCPRCPLSAAELATFATSYSTAEGMLNRAAVGEGDTVLISGASGGVGGALIQLAQRRGAQTIALCGEDKADAVRALGPLAVLPRAPADLRQALKAACGLEQVSVVADVVGGGIFPPMIEVLARGGRYVCSGAIAGPLVELDLRTFYLNNLSFFGSTILPPGTFADLVGYIARGEIKPLLAATYPLEEFHAAQQAFIDKKHTGNIVVQVAEE